MTVGTTLELFCPKWNKQVAEATCNICKDQCDNSVANPDNFIAKKLIVDLERVKGNRLKVHLLKKPIVELTKEQTLSESVPEQTAVLEDVQKSTPVHASKSVPEHAPEQVPDPRNDQEVDDFEAELNNMDFLKTEIEETFKERADVIIESLGLAHMKPNGKAEEEEEKT